MFLSFIAHLSCLQQYNLLHLVYFESPQDTKFEYPDKSCTDILFSSSYTRADHTSSLSPTKSIHVPLLSKCSISTSHELELHLAFHLAGIKSPLMMSEVEHLHLDPNVIFVRKEISNEQGHLENVDANIFISDDIYVHLDINSSSSGVYQCHPSTCCT
ncbi:hypothetical protein J6590_000348 [Homalodisca vitripennis]|nr:hypothetical protein J6590_000348 [Homalodisca vitripennis]